MADALLSPAVGGALWVVSASALGHSAARVRRERDEGSLPLVGVLGAFVFAAQMLNFAIPGTGSSGHLAGTLFLALAVGPHRAFLTMASVLVIQALIFADGGLLALGCNLFNMGFLTAFVAYPLVTRPLLVGQPGPVRRTVAILLGAVVGLQLGALGVVLETILSGRTSLGFKAFLGVMQPIHLAIGLVEGLATLALLGFLGRVRPEVLAGPTGASNAWSVVGKLTLLVVLLAGCLAWYASRRPDGLEWALARLGHGSVAASPGFQKRLALMPDYAPKGAPATRGSTSLAGLGGAGLTLLLVAGVGATLKRRRRAA